MMSELKELLEKVKLENIMAFMIYGADSRRDAFENYEKEIEKSYVFPTNCWSLTTAASVLHRTLKKKLFQSPCFPMNPTFTRAPKSAAREG